MALRLTPVVVSFVLLAAHFSRHDVPVAPYLCLAIPLLLLLRKTWVPRLLQALLAVGTLEWLRTAFVLAGRRMDTGEPWIRLAVILGVVVLFTAGSIALLQTVFPGTVSRGASTGLQETRANLWRQTR